jgi:hypothetical protein
MTVIEPQLTIRPRVARAAGIGLVAYGLVAIVLLALTFVVAGSSIDRLERLNGSLAGTLDLAATTARSSARALDDLGDGIAQGVDGARDASRLADQASTTSAQLATAMGLSIFGTRPLLPMATSFQQLSDQLASLSTNLDSIGSALDTSGQDLDEVRSQMTLLATRLASLAGPTGSTGIIGTGGLRLAFTALLLLLAIPAVGALLVGLTLLMAVRRVPPPLVVHQPRATAIDLPPGTSEREDR